MGRTITSDTASLNILKFEQTVIEDLLRRRDGLKKVYSGERYEVMVTVTLYGRPAKVRCLVRNAASIVLEVDPLTTEDIRHYFRLFKRPDGWRTRRAIVAYGTNEFSPAQRAELIKGLLK